MALEQSRTTTWKTILAVLATATIAIAACSLPHDPDGTLDRVRGAAMRVGYVVDTPWVTDSSGVPGGIEPSLVRELAGELHARVDWTRGDESELLQLVASRELDLVIGGITASLPWSAQAAMTRPYYTDTVLVAGAKGMYAPITLSRLPVEVRVGDPAAAEIRKRGGTPVPTATLDTAHGVVAAPTWRLAQLGRDTTSAIQLSKTPHVLAASAGENAWLVTIDRLLVRRQDGIGAQLRSFHP